MIHLHKGQTNVVILTLTENQNLDSPNYLFILKNRSSNWEKKFVILGSQDLSGNKDRYNKFLIETNTILKNALCGQYIYKVFEQESESNLAENGLHLLETGIIELHDEEVIFTQYSRDNSYKIRQ